MITDWLWEDLLYNVQYYTDKSFWLRPIIATISIYNLYYNRLYLEYIV